MSRVYSLIGNYAKARGDGEILKWGLSRFGDGHDTEVARAVYANHIPGDGSGCCVGFTPERPKLKSAEQMRTQRVQNARRRIQAQAPLFAEQFEAEELAKSRYSIEECESDRAHRAGVYDECAARFWETHTADNQVVLPKTVVAA